MTLIYEALSSKFPTILWIRRVERGTQISGLGYKLQFSAHPHLTDMGFWGCYAFVEHHYKIGFSFSVFSMSQRSHKNRRWFTILCVAFSPLVFLTPSRLLVGWYFDRKLQGSVGLQLCFSFFGFSTLFITWVTRASALRDKRGLRSDTLDWLLVAFPVNGSDDCSAFQF